MLLEVVLALLCSTGSMYAINSGFDRVVMIGDIHGSYNGLIDILHASGIVSAPNTCEWVVQDTSLLLVQTGDIVDRGPGAVEAFDCLRYLQQNAGANNAKVVRLLGNHELWWLENILDHRNPQTDTPAVMKKIINGLVDDVAAGLVVGAYYYEHTVSGHTDEPKKHVPILFTHGGISPEYYAHLEKSSAEFTALKQSGGNVAAFLAESVRSGVQAAMARTCTMISYKSPSNQVAKCALNGELFAAGKERGGGPVGGPFWSDFSVMQASAAAGFYEKTMPGVTQIVGHTMAHCYVYKHERTHTHPKSSENQCRKGLIRKAVGAEGGTDGICIDGGMYLGARAYLTLDAVPGSDTMVQFTAHERGFEDSVQGQGEWGARILSTHTGVPTGALALGEHEL